MEKYFIEVKKNDFVRTFDLSDVENNFELIKSSRLKEIADIKYIAVTLSYSDKRWFKELDIFSFLHENDLALLKSNKAIFILDCALEGYSYEWQSIRISLENSASIHNINPNLIFLFTGNFRDYSNIINVIPVYSIDRSFHLNISSEGLRMDEAMARCQNEFTDKIFLSLSRRTRFHRTLANFILYDTEIEKHGLISQDSDPGFALNHHTLQMINKTREDLQNFKNSLPWIADHGDFSFNDPMNPLTDLHLKTPFSIVNETLTSSENNTSLFFSEKFLKPILAFQPMIIYGQPGINKKLELLGYKNYSSYFNLKFDDEENDIVRFQKLLKTTMTKINHLKLKSKEERIKWRFRDRTLLAHNYNVFLKRKNVTIQMNLFAKMLIKLKKQGIFK